MRRTLLGLLAALAAPSVAQNATQILAELQSLNLTSLVTAAAQLNSTAAGQRLLSELGTAPQTVFAPNNEAWVGAQNVTSNVDLLASVLSYHILPGTFNVTATSPNTTIGRTLLSNLTFLEGNKNQVLAWTNESGTVRILNQNTRVTVTNSTSFGNLTLHVTDAVIDLPGDLVAALSANNLTGFSTALQAAQLLAPLNLTHGVTIFAPTDAAFAAAQANLTTAGANATLLANILHNHVLNGTSAYSGDLIALGGGTRTTAAGETLGAHFNSSGGFVTTGNATAKIVTPDIILWNGVVHVVDTVLFNEEADAGAASSAASSASSAATASTTETGPIGFTPTPTSAGGAGSGSGTASSAAKADLLKAPLAHIGVAGLVSVLGVLSGALLAF